ncbi:hypothetical protein D0T90_07255 [Neisseria animalis]|uniref:Uncharacterized protein n=1 Tax=Neisseria animalis TaxID=492 RepID=A0A5P3MUH1_NEIAN|nr:hypothetical protein D0T90_07255 [Neisseria animalis]ROW32288.1 hypothetical protein CGZ60_05440 [Neisseria animalis]VEE06749.1 Uncharacterised protein [Neisseria animalis]
MQRETIGKTANCTDYTNGTGRQTCRFSNLDLPKPSLCKGGNDVAFCAKQPYQSYLKKGRLQI